MTRKKLERGGCHGFRRNQESPHSPENVYKVPPKQTRCCTISQRTVYFTKLELAKTISISSYGLSNWTFFDTCCWQIFTTWWMERVGRSEFYSCGGSTNKQTGLVWVYLILFITPLFWFLERILSSSDFLGKSNKNQHSFKNLNWQIRMGLLAILLLRLLLLIL